MSPVFLANSSHDLGGLIMSILNFIRFFWQKSSSFFITDLGMYLKFLWKFNDISDNNPFFGKRYSSYWDLWELCKKNVYFLSIHHTFSLSLTKGEKYQCSWGIAQVSSDLVFCQYHVFDSSRKSKPGWPWKDGHPIFQWCHQQGCHCTKLAWSSLHPRSNFGETATNQRYETAEHELSNPWLCSWVLE